MLISNQSVYLLMGLDDDLFDLFSIFLGVIFEGRSYGSGDHTF